MAFDVVKLCNEFLEGANKDLIPAIKQILVKKIKKCVNEHNDNEK